jgi:hypothetical protein
MHIRSDDLDEPRESGPSLTCECRASDDDDILVRIALLARIECVDITDTLRFNAPSAIIFNTFSATVVSKSPI